MSPSRTRKPVAHLRTRSEVVTAVLVGVGIVAATTFLVWAMRPGKPGAQGTGGIMARQPRFWLFLVLAGIALFAAIMWMLRGRRRPKMNPRTAIITTVAVVGVLILVSAIFWPGGLIHHWPSQPKVQTPAATPPTSFPVGTTAHPGTTAKAPTSVPVSTPPTSAKASTPSTTKGA